MPCRRRDCPYEHLDGPRRHGFCCNACRYNEGKHTSNCTGYAMYATTHSIPRTQRPMQGPVGFRIPANWRSGLTVLDQINWYMSRFGVAMPRETYEYWRTFQPLTNLPVNRERELVIHVRKEDNPGPGPNINFARLGLNAHRPSLYNSREVSGIYFEVQAVLLSQIACVYGLTAAVQHIEIGELAEVTFVCTHATHRSVGMACLLAILIYNDATIMFSTQRTQDDARHFGMIQT